MKRVKRSQLTIRFDADLAGRLRSLAASEGISLNQAALRLLRRGAGLGKGQEGRARVGSTLDGLAGTWTEEEEKQFLAALEPLESVDESLWR